MSYEYLVASLPMLFPGDPPPFSVEVFRFQCEGVLTTADRAVLDRVLGGTVEPDDPECARIWAAQDTQLRNAAATARAAVWQTDARPYLKDHPGFDDRVRQIVADAFTKSSPLDRERALDRGRWHLLDDMALREPFGLATVLAFGLKLRMAERWAAWNPDKGQAALDALLNDCVARARPDGNSKHEGAE